MKKLHYTVEVRDKDFKLYKDSRGLNVTGLNFEDEDRDSNLVENICKNTFIKFQAVCKEGSEINIEVRYFNEYTRTYPLLYSFYGDTSLEGKTRENKFIKH